MKKVRLFFAIVFLTTISAVQASPGSCTGTVLIGGDVTLAAVVSDANQNCPRGSAIAAMDIESGETFWITVK